jgi:hypothetical protein
VALGKSGENTRKESKQPAEVDRMPEIQDAVFQIQKKGLAALPLNENGTPPKADNVN